MAALAKIDYLIAHCVAISGYINPVAYDELHSLFIGYWICKVCKSSFLVSGKHVHKSLCSMPLKEFFFDFPNKDMIYVMGPQERGFLSPLKKEDVEKIKEIARSHNIVKEDLE